MKYYHPITLLFKKKNNLTIHHVLDVHAARVITQIPFFHWRFSHAQNLSFFAASHTPNNPQPWMKNSLSTILLSCSIQLLISLTTPVLSTKPLSKIFSTVSLSLSSSGTPFYFHLNFLLCSFFFLFINLGFFYVIAIIWLCCFDAERNHFSLWGICFRVFSFDLKYGVLASTNPLAVLCKLNPMCLAWKILWLLVWRECLRPSMVPHSFHNTWYAFGLH